MAAFVGFCVWIVRISFLQKLLQLIGNDVCNGKDLEIIPEEAQLIQWMFQSYLDGRSLDWIAQQMTHHNILTRDGKPYWQRSTIQYILKNEKYIGCTLCQKTLSSGFPFKNKRNHGEVDKYYVESTHPAIINQETFDRVQALFKKKTPLLARKIICGKCGTLFKRRVSKKGVITWYCRRHDMKATDCPVGRIPEDEINSAFVRMYNKLRLHDGIILQPAVRQLDELIEAMSRVNPAMLEINKGIAQIAEQCHKITRLQTDGLIDAEACGAKVTALNAKLTKLRVKRRNIMQNDNVNEQIEIIQQTIGIITDDPEELKEFDEKLFTDLVEQIIAESQTRIRFRLYGGIELTENVKGAGR